MQKGGDGILVVAFLSAVIMFRKLDRPARIFAIYMIASVISEVIAYLVAKEHGDNMAVYNIYSLWEYAIICLYFNEIIDVFYKRRIGLFIASLGLLVGIFNIIFVQGLHSINSYFLVYEGVTIIIMALFFFSRLLLLHDELRLYTYPHFWLAFILTFYWTATFIGWNLYDYAFRAGIKKISPIYMLTITSSILAYLMGSVVLILFPKISSSNE